MENVSGVYDGTWGIQCTHTKTGAPLLVNPFESYSPTELCVTALATCTLIKLGYYAQKHGLDLTGTRFSATEDYAEARKRIASITVVYHMAGGPFSAKDKEAFQRVAASCPVHNSLLPDIAVTLSFEWND